MVPKCSMVEVERCVVFGKIEPEDEGEDKYFCSEADIGGDNGMMLDGPSSWLDDIILLCW